MAFTISKFYEELDQCYQTHDNEKTEAFLKEMLEASGRLHDTGILPSGCPSCAEAVTVNLEYVSVCNEAACFYRGLSRWQKSLELFGEALRELERFGLQNTENYAVILLNRAGTLRLTGRLEEALSAFLAAEKFFLGQTEPNGYVLAGIHNNMALLYQDKKEPELAVRYIRKALGELPDSTETLPERASSLNNLAAALQLSGHPDEAQQTVEESISIFEKTDAANAHYPAALNTLASLQFRDGAYAQAAENFQKALEKTELIYGKNSDYRNGCLNLADALEKKGETDRAAHYREEAGRLQKLFEQEKNHGADIHRTDF